MSRALIHGWSHGASYWAEWEGTPSDRGYYGAPCPVEKADEIFAHSFGAHLLSAELLRSAQRVVLLSTFVHLRGGALDAFYEEVTADPLSALQIFDKRCGLPCRSSIPTDLSLLLDDLGSMATSSLDLTTLRDVPEVVIVTGDVDRIVAPRHSHRLHQALPGSRLVIVEGAGHALPYTHREACCDL